MRERAAATEKSICWPAPRIAVVGMPLVVDESVAQHVLVKLPMINFPYGASPHLIRCSSLSESATVL
jgi:hypothetical protein